MKQEDVEAYLTSQGVTPEQLIAEKAHLDQIHATLDEIDRWACEGLLADDPATADHAAWHVRQIAMATDPVDLVLVLVLRLNRLRVDLAPKEARIAELEAENARLRRGR